MAQENIVLDTIIDADEIKTAETGSIYIPSQICAASFLGSPLAGAYMLAYNCNIMNVSIQKRVSVWLLGIFLFLSPYFMSFLFPENPFIRMIILACVATAIMFFYAKNIFKTEMESFWDKGGDMKGAERVIFMSCLFFMLSFMLNILLIGYIDGFDDYAR